MQEFIRNIFNIKSSELEPLPSNLCKNTLQNFIDLDLTRLTKFFDTTNIKSKKADPKKLALMLDLSKSLVSELQLLKFHDMSTEVLAARVLVDQEELKTYFSTDKVEELTWNVNYCKAILQQRKEETHVSAN